MLEKAADSEALNLVILTPRCLPCPGPNHGLVVPVKNNTKHTAAEQALGQQDTLTETPGALGASEVNPLRLSNTRLVKNPCAFQQKPRASCHCATSKGLEGAFSLLITPHKVHTFISETCIKAH